MAAGDVLHTDPHCLSTSGAFADVFEEGLQDEDVESTSEENDHSPHSSTAQNEGQSSDDSEFDLVYPSEDPERDDESTEMVDVGEQKQKVEPTIYENTALAYADRFQLLPIRIRIVARTRPMRGPLSQRPWIILPGRPPRISWKIDSDTQVTVS